MAKRKIPQSQESKEFVKAEERSRYSGCYCQHCGRDMIPSLSGRGDTYCSCREDNMSPEDREAFRQWVWDTDRH